MRVALARFGSTSIELTSFSSLWYTGGGARQITGARLTENGLEPPRHVGTILRRVLSYNYAVKAMLEPRQNQPCCPFLSVEK